MLGGSHFILMKMSDEEDKAEDRAGTGLACEACRSIPKCKPRTV